MDRRVFLQGALAATGVAMLPGSAWAQGDGGRRDILVGQSADLSGMSQNLARDYFTGAKVALDQANSAGGIAGRRIRIVQLDDAGEPAQAQVNAKKLIEDERVDMLFGLTGESCVEAVVASPAFKGSDIELFAPLTGALHPGAQGRAIYLRPTYGEEMAIVLNRFAKLSLSRLAIIHTALSSAVAARDATVSALASRHLAAPRVYAVKNGATDVQALVKRIQADNPQAVVVLADTVLAALLTKALRTSMPGLFICLTSAVDVTSVGQIIGMQAAQGLMVSRVVPDPLNGVVPVVASFRRALTKYLDEAPSSAGLEGYIAGQALLAVLRKAESPRKLVAVAQRRIGELDVGGWKLNFTKDRASEMIELAMVSRDGRLI